MTILAMFQRMPVTCVQILKLFFNFLFFFIYFYISIKYEIKMTISKDNLGLF